MNFDKYNEKNIKKINNMNAKEFRRVLQYFCCRWSQDECNLVINGSNFDPTKWKYSLGDHIWNKWLNAMEHHMVPWIVLHGYT